jgi:predicted phosphodiesterase
MRYGIVSDIHSNLDALNAVLKELDGLDMAQLVCLGDIVGYGPDPNECCELLRARNCLAIAGNHDEAVAKEDVVERFNSLAAQAIAWTREKLTPENRRYLLTLPLERHFDTFDIVHGAPHAHFEYITDATDACNAFEHVQRQVTFIGHTHVAEVFFQESVQTPPQTYHQRLANGGRIEVAPQFRYIVNPGSVGQPRDRNPQASFGLFDDDRKVIEIHRVGYDVSNVRKKMERADLPVELAERLSMGY